MALVQNPTTLGEALKCEDASKWEAAMEDEYHSLVANGIWKLNPPKRSQVGGWMQVDFQNQERCKW